MKTYKVPVRVLIEAFMEVDATSTRLARAHSLGLLGGLDPKALLPRLDSMIVVAHDAAPHADIIETDTAVPIGKVRREEDQDG